LIIDISSSIVDEYLVLAGIGARLIETIGVNDWVVVGYDHLGVIVVVERTGNAITVRIDSNSSLLTQITEHDKDGDGHKESKTIEAPCRDHDSHARSIVSWLDVAIT